eukprot:5169802-Pleurochrysis_carterae.AAC.1
MFCLAYARRPDALQGRKLEPARADKRVHLGTSPNKPGYRLEVLGKGKHITTTQVVLFRKTVFPLRAEYQPPEDDSDGPSTDEYM